MTHGPDFDELVGSEASGTEREGLRRAHELLVQAGPPPELTPQLRKAPTFEVARLEQRRNTKRRVLLLLAAAVSVGAVFGAGYAVADHGGGNATTGTAPRTISLAGTRFAPHASATLAVWHARDGNWPMTLSVVGLPKLPQHRYYEVYLVRDGKPWGSCGTFRVAGSSHTVTLTLNAPYSLHRGDSWVVTRPGPSASEPGRTVLRPVSA